MTFSYMPWYSSKVTSEQGIPQTFALLDQQLELPVM